MSDVARFWSRNLRGLNFAEHAVCRELAEFHNEHSDECYPNLLTITDIFECSRPYLKKILCRLDNWALVTRIEWFDELDRNRQTSNRFRLNLRRHFPDPGENRKTRDKNKNQTPRTWDNRDHEALAAAKQGRRILSIIANKIPNNYRGLMDGLKEAYFDQANKTTYVTVEAEAYLRDFRLLQPDLTLYVNRETKLSTTLTPLPLFFKPKKR